MYLLPNLITISNFTCGVLSIFAVLFSDIDAAILFIILGMLFDLLDGTVARKFHAVSDFGKELDSLSDIVTFCVAPSLLVYSVSLYQLSLIGLLATLSFSICGLIRLARFNVEQSRLSTFIGMPAPLAAFCLLAMTFVFDPVILALGTCLLAYLMVSGVKFPHFKNNGDKREIKNGAS